MNISCDELIGQNSIIISTSKLVSSGSFCKCIIDFKRITSNPPTAISHQSLLIKLQDVLTRMILLSKAAVEVGL